MWPAGAELSHESLLTFLELEEQAARADYEQLMALPREERVLRGYTLTDLTPAGPANGDEVLLECGEQVARYGPGERVRLTAGSIAVGAVVLGQEGTQLRVRTDRALPQQLQWVLEPEHTSYADLARQAIAQVDDYHGAVLWQALNGELNDLATGAGIDDWTGALGELEAETGLPLAPDQRAAFAAAVATPTLWALQGPPGTGKTVTAAYVAEALARVGEHRLVVTALSHEAVNRLLHEIHGHFPDRPVVKVASTLREPAGQGIRTVTPQQLMAQKLLRKKPILGMTVHTALLMATVYGLRSDVVIVDEASQVPLAYGAQLGLLGYSVLLLGDPAQLNAIFPGAAAGQPLACSLLERAAASYPLQHLTLTYRLNGQLTDLVGSVFYPDGEGRSSLAPAAGAAARRLAVMHRELDPWAEAVLDPEHSAVWVRTAEYGRRQSSSREADLVVRLVERLQADGISGREVGVVTPFRQQAQLLAGRLAALPADRRPRLGTVETMQGQSVEVILISLAASDPGYLGAIDTFFFLPNRWNVAVSRARTKVVVVSSEMMLAAAMGTELRTVLRRMKRVEAAG